MATGGHPSSLPTDQGISSPPNPLDNSLLSSSSTPKKGQTELKSPASGVDSDESSQFTTLLGNAPGRWGMLVSQDKKLKTIYLSGNSFLIGRNKNSDIVFNEPSTSTSIFKLWYSQLHGKLVILEHLGSTGTLRVHDKLCKTAGQRQLRTGDEIVLYTGATTLTLYFVAKEETAATSKELSGMCSNGKSVSENFKNMCRDIGTLNRISAANSKARQGKEPGKSSLALLDHSNLALQHLPVVDLHSNNSQFNKAKLEAMADGMHGKEDNFPKLSAKEKAMKAVFVAAIRKMVVDRDQSSFNSFPYYLSDHVKFQLKSICFMHLKRPDFLKYTTDLPSLSPRILLTGPAGSELMQATLVKFLAADSGAKLLCFPGINQFLKPLQESLSNLGQEQNMADASETDKNRAEILRKKEDAENAEYGFLITPEQIPNHTFKLGDCVRYYGFNFRSPGAYRPDLPPNPGRCPPTRGRGIVCVVFENNPLNVGVLFDQSFPGGINLDPTQNDNRGYVCKTSDLRLDLPPSTDMDRLICDTVFEVASSIAKEGPLILFFQDSGMSIFDIWKYNASLKTKLDQLEGRIVIFRSVTSDPDAGNDKSPGLPKMPVAQGGMMDMFEGMLKEPPRKDFPKHQQLLPQHFLNKVTITAPKDPVLLSEWKKKLQEDSERVKAGANILQIGLVLANSNIDCPELAQIDFQDPELPKEAAERIVGWAVSDHLMCWPEPAIEGEKLIISKKSVETALEQWRVHQKESDKAGLQEISPENEFEKRILSEVIPPTEIGVSFNDIGALDSVKTTLKELVMLPLQRPELFQRGQLTKPCKGILLFGPPGTGKTMLAKAVATEASANFINISMSAIASKWFGEGEKYVKAIFTLASKIAPSVIFIDEVDSMLGRREQPTEHEAMRRMKNEFMAHWDGLKTRAEERILVLAATNRPFDLDDAVIRRLPRRLMVSLPDTENRAKILTVILGKEELETGFDFAEVASMADGFSGSDLKNLCVTAAYRPIREILEREELESAKANLKGGEVPPLTGRGGKPVEIRCLNVDDFKQAMEQVGASVSSEAASLQELQQWNEQYGDGGSRKKEALSYFL